MIIMIINSVKNSNSNNNKCNNYGEIITEK